MIDFRSFDLNTCLAVLSVRTVHKIFCDITYILLHFIFLNTVYIDESYIFLYNYNQK